MKEHMPVQKKHKAASWGQKGASLEKHNVGEANEI